METHIGRYEIKGEIATGGMATVYRAFDPNFERDVAIKILPKVYLQDEQFRIRFEREAKIIAQLEHPAIVPVYDFAEEDGQPFIVMRYMAGGSLNERVNQGALNLTESVRILARVASALDAAHAHNIIHRDIKPANILFDHYGNAFLTDFGIARLKESGVATLTGTNLMGTPAYMSPEQIQGDKTIDGRSDIYALGVLAYHMLSGQLPYFADTPTAVMMMHINQSPPSLAEVRHGAPPQIDALIQKAMAKDRNQRFATAGEFANQLERAIQGSSSIPMKDMIASQENQRLDPSTLPLSTAETLVTEGAGAPFAAKKRKTKLLPVIAGLGVTILLAGIFLMSGLLGGNGASIFSILGGQPTATITSSVIKTSSAETRLSDTPTFTPFVPTNTVESTLTPTKEAADSSVLVPTFTEQPAPPIIGGADMLAFLKNNDIWVANLDGSNLEQLTEDGTEKTSLQWTPDGQAINYISGTCVQTVRLKDGRIDIITCFNFVEYLKSFVISPDGSQVAISLDNQLYIVPYQPEALGEVRTRSELARLATCEHFAPYTKVFVKLARWSADSNQIAMVVFGVASGIGSADIIQVLPVDSCIESPRPLDNFPPPRFRPEEYEKSPAILNFSWDGYFLFAFNTLIRNNGFGHLYIYNMDLHKARMKVNPIEEKCCYRDATWSPDGSYLLFAFQDMSAGANSPIVFYYIPYGSLGSGATYEPLPIPPIENPEGAPLPVLRPAVNNE